MIPNDLTTRASKTRAHSMYPSHTGRYMSGEECFKVCLPHPFRLILQFYIYIQKDLTQLSALQSFEYRLIWKSKVQQPTLFNTIEKIVKGNFVLEKCSKRKRNKWKSKKKHRWGGKAKRKFKKCKINENQRKEENKEEVE